MAHKWLKWLTVFRMSSGEHASSPVRAAAGERAKKAIAS